jgi:hypothetical protein
MAASALLWRAGAALDASVAALLEAGGDPRASTPPPLSSLASPP